ncbi:cation:proton antiporter [Sphingomonas sp. TREG-RG-20F-R18-01]|uniref:cation:proton antiporter n=1 Tax=Sphingomonas sp. TREG-RG-20F-R18-01 TaxID=2914982 RepID=UPI001F59267B|nr:cation:proton antiporter [Sphingomonas sp. TREG-RG-20F-R18-01]
MLQLPHEMILLGIGVLILLAAWLPLLLRRLPLSLPIICIALGLLLSLTPWFRASQSALTHDSTLEHLNEGIVLIALMGAGLRLDRKFGWRRWRSTWRLLLIVMPVTMIVVFAAAHWSGGLGVGAALLLAAALAPTDPVLAADVQTGPPTQGEDGETRFGLTSEAGLNDGLAFPFILLAISLQSGTVDWLHWSLVQVALDLVLGVAIGWALGAGAGYLMFRLPAAKLSDTGDGLVAIGVTFCAYALTVVLHGNGFVAVFIAALTIRSTCPDNEFHAAMSEFSGQIERVLMTVVMVLFGWAVGRGLLAPLDLWGALLVVAIVFVIRPLASLLAFAGTDTPGLSKRLMGFFGIRGIGTLFYLQYAFNRAQFSERSQIWAIAGATILLSIVVHGMTATPLMAHADARREKRLGRRNRGSARAAARRGPSDGEEQASRTASG